MFIVPGVCRFTVNGTLGGRDIANIVDMRIDTTGSTATRSEVIEDQAGILINEWSDHVLVRIVNDYQALNVSWVDLDDEEGSTGERNVTSQETWPQNGAVATDPMPANVAALVTKAINAGRSRRNGRMFISGLTETITDTTNGNRIAAASLASFQTDMTSFLGNINQDSGGNPLLYDSFMCVTHVLTRDANDNPLTGDSRDVDALNVQSLLATQRRRLRG